jgi:anti-sigma B factor antagonist
MLEIVTTEAPRGLRVIGEVDLANADELREALEPEVRAGGDITLDLSGLRFMSSTGIQVIIQALQKLTGRGTLVVISPTSAFRQLLRVTGLERFENLDVRESP